MHNQPGLFSQQEFTERKKKLNCWLTEWALSLCADWLTAFCHSSLGDALIISNTNENRHTTTQTVTLWISLWNNFTLLHLTSFKGQKLTSVAQTVQSYPIIPVNLLDSINFHKKMSLYPRNHYKSMDNGHFYDSTVLIMTDLCWWQATWTILIENVQRGLITGDLNIQNDQKGWW